MALSDQAFLSNISWEVWGDLVVSIRDWDLAICLGVFLGRRLDLCKSSWLTQHGDERYDQGLRSAAQIKSV